MKIPSKIIDLCGMLDDKKAEDIVVCYNNGKNVVDYFIVATASSSAHIKGISEYVESECAKLPLVYGNIVVEGFSISSWVVLDVGDVFIHLFTREERSHYNFDKFINDGGNVTSYKKLKLTLERDKKRELLKEEHENKAKLKQKAKQDNKEKRIKNTANIKYENEKLKTIDVINNKKDKIENDIKEMEKQKGSELKETLEKDRKKQKKGEMK